MIAFQPILVYYSVIIFLGSWAHIRTLINLQYLGNHASYYELCLIIDMIAHLKKLRYPDFFTGFALQCAWS